MLLKVPAEAARDGGEVGIFVQPTWYGRPFAYDASVRC
jgi:hypothetical protein